MTSPIKKTQLILSGHVAVLSRLGEPVSGFDVILLNRLFVIALGVKQAKSVFSDGVSLPRQDQELLEIRSIGRCSGRFGRLSGSENGRFGISRASLNFLLNQGRKNETEDESDGGSGEDQ